MTAQYDELVKGWIFGSVKEKVLKDLVDFGTAQEVWMKIGSLCNLPISNPEGDSSNALGVSAPDAIAPVVYAMREDLKYLQALNVDVSNFISEKLEDERNYYTWKNEMLSLIRSHEFLHIIHAEEARFPWDEGDPMTQKYDSLVRGWILNTMNDNQHNKYRRYRSVQLMWRRLESTFTYQPETSNSNTGDTKGILECNEDDSSNETEDLKYMKSNVNIYDFVSVKLSGRSNYNIRKDQMLRLLQSHSLLHIIDEEAPSQQDKDDSMTKKYDSLVRVF
ncbi:hypothetical protein M8C21_030392 [Ambrosia artemisiifolia]|uniref:Uncharacterized protein n=1 Tax=Ambrosia artemisiifolia TaxID=4212 RepID=A0AAD5GFT4_AMBAR|nr:hypothetical protein M8C21_030392 [Ambrosia artemisiifolia]